jgi:hypothetical protein
VTVEESRMSYPPQEPQQPQPYWTQPPGLPPHGVPGPAYMGGPPPVPPGRKRSKMPFILGGIGAVLLLCIGGTVATVAASDSARDSFQEGYQARRDELNHATPEPTVPATPTADVPTKAPTTKAPARSTRPAPAKTTTAAAEPAPEITVPNGVGLDYQAAQDLWRAAGLHVAPAVDATGANRLPVIDSNWVVLSQDPKAGSTVAADSMITATVKKFSDD